MNHAITRTRKEKHRSRLKINNLGETPHPHTHRKPSSSRVESTLTGEDVGVSVLLLVVVLVGRLVRPAGVTPRQELHENKEATRLNPPLHRPVIGGLKRFCFDSDPYLRPQIVGYFCRASVSCDSVTCAGSSVALREKCESAGRGRVSEETYVELLPEELPVVRRAEPVLLLQVVHGDGQVGLSGRGGSGQKDHRLLICRGGAGAGSLVWLLEDSRIRIRMRLGWTSASQRC